MSSMEMDQILAEFPQEDGLYYLNHAAVSPWPRRTADAVAAFANENVIHGAQHYPQWVDQESHLREQIKTLINAPSVDDIALLKNTSEALSVVAEGIQWQAGDNIVSSDQEFPSNRIPWQAQARHEVEFREVDLAGAETPELALINACDEKTKLLSISSVQYGTGLKVDLAQLGRFCHDNDILFCVDAIQSIGAHPIDVQTCQADFVMADGHKWMLGPEGIALFYCREELRQQLQLHQYGWHMVKNAGDYNSKTWSVAETAKRFECGSPNMLGIFALSTSLSLILEIGMGQIEKTLLNKTSYLIENLKEINGIQLLTPEQTERRAGIVTFKIGTQDMADIHRNLMKNKVICAHRGGGVRFSPHFYTSQKIIDKSLEILTASL